MADLLQAGAKVGVLACPGGPRIRMFVGRPEDKTPAPVGLLPPVFFTADQLIDLFANKTVSPGGLVALIGAHTASRNHSATTTLAPPQDRTPGKWDTEYFSEHLRPNASAGVFRFPSDVSLAQSPRTGPVFQQFSAAKGAWDEAYAKEYIRMSLMGVKKINALRECSKVLPRAADKPEPDEPEPSSTPSHRSSTSVVYQTRTYTVTSCPPDKTNCPYGSHATSLAPVSTITAEADHHANANAHGHTDVTSPVRAAPTSKAPVPVTAGAGCLSASLYAVAAMVGLLATSFM
ncbi:heme peroxidase [Immersiella caudata]|uniref:Peroxidase n=1 Tax=Immersiella caudata TaxID=314043 RepID=A0AA40BZU5_9PEZI|nr:heme peroxidase [Immersiella caudata]